MTVNLRPLDIDKLDFDGIRRRTRKRLILWSLTPVIAALIAIGWFVFPMIATNIASVNVASGNYDAAAWWLSVAGYSTPPDSYKVPFNRAIVETDKKQYDQADTDFIAAVTLAPNDQKCFIRVQSVLSTELAGDNAALSDKQKAIQYYTKALADSTANPDCFKQYSQLTTDPR